jgi:hypothetical protein
MMPDMARVIGALSADHASRALHRTLLAVGYAAPSRAFLADHVTAMCAEVADSAPALDEAARAAQVLPTQIASVSCGLDRMSVRMAEPKDDVPCTRRQPYERTPPKKKEHHYRKAWVGSVSTYDADGRELSTWRYAVEADADPHDLARRVAADVAAVVAEKPGAPVLCIQDAAPELGALPTALSAALPRAKEVVELIDFEHLAGYLDAVATACDPADTHDMKSWYRSTLLSDDGGIDRIQQNLRRHAKRLSAEAAETRAAIAAALRYIRSRKDKMRYASYYRQDLPIGSGATESTCWQMQQRVKLAGQSWEPHGLRGVLAVRALVLSDRWEAAWDHYAGFHRAEVSIGA